MKVPNFEKAVVPKEKLQDYLLSESHPVGRFKAVFFQQLGYSSAAWEVLANDIRILLENEVAKTIATDFGTEYEVRGQIDGPSGKSANVVTVWVVLKGEEFSCFVTAYPGEK